jgi:hypothetical protein
MPHLKPLLCGMGRDLRRFRGRHRDLRPPPSPRARPANRGVRRLRSLGASATFQGRRDRGGLNVGRARRITFALPNSARSAARSARIHRSRLPAPSSRVASLRRRGVLVGCGRCRSGPDRASSHYGDAPAMRAASDQTISRICARPDAGRPLCGWDVRPFRIRGVQRLGEEGCN